MTEQTKLTEEPTRYKLTNGAGDVVGFIEKKPTLVLVTGGGAGVGRAVKEIKAAADNWKVPLRLQNALPTLEENAKAVEELLKGEPGLVLLINLPFSQMAAVFGVEHIRIEVVKSLDSTYEGKPSIVLVDDEGLHYNCDMVVGMLVAPHDVAQDIAQGVRSE